MQSQESKNGREQVPASNEKKVSGISFHPPVMRKEKEETSLLSESSAAQTQPFASTVQAGKNETGLPDQLKSGIESLSSIDISDVRVHYNSPAPAQLHALAFAQGNNIHIGPGQEKHVAHEAWHVVQQRQGRVKPTFQLNQVPVNDDAALETEADRMGTLALQAKPSGQALRHMASQGQQPVQRIAKEAMEDGKMYFLSMAGGTLRYCRFLGTDDRGAGTECWFEEGANQRFYYKATDEFTVQTEDELAGAAGGVDNTTIAGVILSLANQVRELHQLLMQTGIKSDPKKVSDVTLADRLLSYCLEWEDAIHDLSPKDTQFVDRLSPESWSSCFSTADKLFNMLGNGADAGRDTGAAKAVMPAPETENAETAASNYDELSRVVTAFLDDIRASAGNTQRVYNCAYGIHGFSVILRANRIEMLQSFAHGVDKGLPNSTLAESANSGAYYDIAAFIDLFAALAMGRNADSRHAAQGRVFSSWLEDYNQVFPYLQFKWKGRTLKSNPDIILTLSEKILGNLREIKALSDQFEGKARGRTKAAKDANEIKASFMS